MKLRIRKSGTRLAVASLAILSLTIGAGAPAQASARNGTVRCYLPSPNDFVTGVWVEVAGGGSGWAARGDLPEDTQGNWWSYDIPEGRSYKLHIGCGGSTQTWATSTKSRWTTTGTDAIVTNYYWSRKVVWS
jgi:hypothetical protein